MTVNYKKHSRVNHIDHYISSRVRLCRLLLGYSQEKIAKAIGVSIQQVQKYEKGKNRISGGNLYLIGKILAAPIAYFFENVEANIANSASVSKSDDDSTFVTNEREVFALVKAYNNITCPRARKQIIDLMAALSSK